MDVMDFQSRLVAILAEEEATSVDWIRIQKLCLGLAEEFKQSGQECPEVVFHYLCDADIRSRDLEYADAQREAVRHYVVTGEYDDGVAIPWWGCLGVVGIIGGFLAWLLR